MDRFARVQSPLRRALLAAALAGGCAIALATRYGVMEKIYKAPADSLRALRIGARNAAVHNSTMQEALIKQSGAAKRAGGVSGPGFAGLSLTSARKILSG